MGPSKKKHGAGTTTSSPGRTSERKQSASACIAPFVTRISAVGVDRAPRRPAELRGEGVAQLDEPARRRRGHRPAQHAATASTTWSGSAGDGVPASGTGSIPSARASSSARSAS